VNANDMEGATRDPRQPPAVVPQGNGDHAAAYSACLAELAGLLGMEPSAAEPGTREWRNVTRAAIWRVIGGFTREFRDLGSGSIWCRTPDNRSAIRRG